MKQLTYLFSLIVCMGFVHTTEAQRGVCGLTHDDQEQIVQQVAKHNEKRAAGILSTRTAEDIYVPVHFHLVAESDGSGRVRKSAVLNQLARLNRDYKEVGMQFYFDEMFFTEINNSGIYNGPGSLGASINSRKDNNSLNVFVTRDASTGNQLGGITLGYYTRQFDFVVCINGQIQDTTNTLSHEVGHFFSLPHTHRGWDNEDYDPAVHGNPLNTMFAPNGSIAERADSSNCSTAGDLMCDTPADYNFGFRNGNCIWNKTSKNIRDFNGDLLDPMEENQMGYFSACSNYDFTPMQIDMMLDDYETTRRNYLRSSYVPNTDELVGKAEIITPENRAELENYDNIFLDWEEVPGATHYIVEMSANNIGYDESWIVTESELFIGELEPDTRFSYRIYPYNEGNAAFESPSLLRFTTGLSSVSTTEVSEIENIQAYPNPLTIGENLHIAIKAKSAFGASVSIVSMDGSIVYSDKLQFHEGLNTTDIPAQDLVKGMYLLTIESVSGTTHKKVMVKHY